MSNVFNFVLGLSCGKPDVDPEAVIEGDSYLFEDKVKIICPPGTEIFLFIYLNIWFKLLLLVKFYMINKYIFYNIF